MGSQNMWKFYLKDGYNIAVGHHHTLTKEKNGDKFGLKAFGQKCLPSFA